MKFIKPTSQEIAQFLTSEKNYDDFSAMGFADKFWNYYESKGWVVGKSPMKNWKAAIRTWEINKKNYETDRGTIKHSVKTAGAYELLDKLKAAAGRKENP